MNRSILLLIMLFSGISIIRAQEGTDQPGCVDCHSDLVEGEGIHYPTTDACDNCHMSTDRDHPSGQQGDFTLADSLPGLCFICHDISMHENKYSHGAQSSGSCISCHDPHRSENLYLLKAPKRELCFSCHGEIRDENELMFRHYPFEDDCGNCHLSHASEYPALLNAAFPAGLYAPGTVESFALCFNCHETGLLEEDSTSWATEFRDGEKNLHYLHLRGSKARSCKLCHAAHASPNQFIMAGTVQFGQWNMPVGFLPLKDGGACNSGCHSRKSYSRSPGSLND